MQILAKDVDQLVTCVLHYKSVSNAGSVSIMAESSLMGDDFSCVSECAPY